MDYNDATGVLDAEALNMSSGTNKDHLQAAMLIIKDGESTQVEKAAALELINDVYFDGTWSNRLEAGQAIFTISYTVDPSKPMPTTRED